ncbi:MAG: AraC family transcriptional regulator [Puniceicoccaceae bacterium]
MRTATQHFIPSFIAPEVQKADYFFHNLNPDSGASLTIVCGGIEVCGKAYHVQRSAFPYHGLEYIVSGHCNVNLDGNTTALSAGSLFCYGPHQQLQLRALSPHPLVKCFVDFSGTQAETLLAPLHAHAQHQAALSHLPWIRSNFQQLIDLGKAKQTEACHQLLQLILSQVPPPQALRRPSRSAGHALCQQSLEHIERDFASLRSLRDLADAVHVSEAYLCRVFQKHHNESPSRALTRRKMEVAAQLLFVGTELVKTVAAKVGYEDPCHFSRLFKQHYGVAPAHFFQRNQSRIPSRNTAIED